MICGLLFCATAINYIDRQTVSVLKPLLQSDFSWSEIDYGDIVFTFQAAYAVSYLVFGRLIDRLGARTMSKYAGWVLEGIDSYTPIFAVAASGYLLALAAIHLLSPRYEPANLAQSPEPGQ